MTIGAVFGVGFLRELLKMNYAKMEQVIIAGHSGDDREQVEAYLQRFEAAPMVEKKRMLADMKQRAREHASTLVFAKKERKAFKRAYKKQLVKRSLVVKIIAAWIITVPATACLAAVAFHAITWSGLGL